MKLCQTIIPDNAHLIYKSSKFYLYYKSVGDSLKIKIYMPNKNTYPKNDFYN